MKSIKTTLAALVFIAAILPWVSCKKADKTPRSTQNRIAGKWKFELSVIDNFYSGTSHITTYTGNASDYVDFRNDSKVYSFVDGNYDTSAYGIISDTKMWIGASSAVFDIQTLTDTDFKIYMKEIYGPGDYHESTINLKR
ncbi:MAG: hypothetical protein ABIR78_07815 [Ferruginibacter sp.]